MELNPKRSRRFEIRLPKFLEFRVGYVYAIRVGGYIKIGKTKHPDSRLKKYELYPPFDFKLIFLKKVPDQSFYERAIQLYFDEFRIKGEWFRFGDEDVEGELNNIYNDITRQVEDDSIFPGYWTEVRDKFLYEE